MKVPNTTLYVAITRGTDSSKTFSSTVQIPDQRNKMFLRRRNPRLPKDTRNARGAKAAATFLQVTTLLPQFQLGGLHTRHLCELNTETGRGE